MPVDTSDGPEGTVLAEGKRRVGRRGALLTELGALYLLIGLRALVGGPPVSVTAAGEVVSIVPQQWFWAWMAAGVVAVVYAWVGRGSERGDWPGFVALSIPAAWWAATYAWAWVVWIVGGPGSGGAPFGWLTSAMYGLLTALVVTVAGVREGPSPDSPDSPAARMGGAGGAGGPGGAGGAGRPPGAGGHGGAGGAGEHGGRRGRDGEHGAAGAPS